MDHEHSAVLMVLIDNMDPVISTSIKRLRHEGCGTSCISRHMLRRADHNKTYSSGLAGSWLMSLQVLKHRLPYGHLPKQLEQDLAICRPAHNLSLDGM